MKKDAPLLLGLILTVTGVMVSSGAIASPIQGMQGGYKMHSGMAGHGKHRTGHDRSGMHGKKGGKLLIDFLNPYTVIHNLVPQEIREIDGITFYIRKFLSDDGYIIKDIEIEEHSHKQYFQERVKAIRRVRFLEYFQQAGLTLEKIFGDYELNDYIAEKSERMIFLLSK